MNIVNDSLTVSCEADNCIVLPVDSVAEIDYEFVIDFEVNKTEIDRSLANNAATLDSLDNLLESMESIPRVNPVEVVVHGTASAEGNYKANERLATQRMMSLRNYLLSRHDINDVLHTGTTTITWSDLRREIERSRLAMADTMLKICREGEDTSPPDAQARMDKLRRLYNGEAWRQLKQHIFTKLKRTARVEITAQQLIPTTPLSQPAKQLVSTDTCIVAEVQPVAVDTVPEIIEIIPPIVVNNNDVEVSCPHGWHLATNVAEWAMLVSNISAEWDFDCHWSAALSLHYSAMNYGTSTRKFRTFILRPELRWWPGRNHTGLFVDAHVQMAAYNVALSHWRYRIQDVGGKNPALGGGLGIGYRLPIGHNNRWALQAQIGGGVYHLHYNRYENHINGRLVDTHTRTWLGIDNVALSIIYNL